MAGIRGVDYIDENGNRIVTGGKLCALKNKAKDPLYYAKLGSKGGKNGVGSLKGFAANPELAKIVGSRGGAVSRRRKAVANG